MSVLSRAALEDSSLADLHEIAKELGLEGFRRLRKADLIDALVAAQNGGTAAAPASTDSDDDEGTGRRRSRRGGRGRARRDPDPDGGDADASDDQAAEPATSGRGRPRRERSDADEAKPARAPRRERARQPVAAADSGEDRVVTGTVELSGSGSGFVRAKAGEVSEGDAYISAAQVRRCELVDGDVVSGPVRAPRRSERHPSLVRIDTINGKAAEEAVEGTRFDDLPCAFPSERFALGAEDPTLKAIEWLTPLGHGSRATITGAARSGKSEALRRLGAALQAQSDLEVHVVLVGTRAEETGDWKAAGLNPAATETLGVTADTAAQAVEHVLSRARNEAVRGKHVVVLIDGLDVLAPGAARKALASARNLTESGSLTVVATAAAPVGGETTVIALDVTLTSTGRIPALDLATSGTMRPELLVGEAGAQAITEARANAIGI